MGLHPGPVGAEGARRRKAAALSGGSPASDSGWARPHPSMWRPRGGAPRKQLRGWSLPAARPDHSAIQAAKPALSKGAVGASSPFVLRAPGPGLQAASWDRKPFVMEKLSNLHPRESSLIHPGIQHWSREPTPGGGSMGAHPSGAGLLHPSPVLCLGVSCWVIRSSLQAQ